MSEPMSWVEDGVAVELNPVSGLLRWSFSHGDGGSMIVRPAFATRRLIRLTARVEELEAGWKQEYEQGDDKIMVLRAEIQRLRERNEALEEVLAQEGITVGVPKSAGGGQG